jgi:uncharacterized protein YbgA (DUF1722 family)/uncharacterized protein YbbK (DUF523 family)
MATRPIKIGVSACLLGQNVRYDGSHQRNRYLTDILGRFVSWVPVCPEVECGLPVPREAMRLVGDKDNPRLVTRKTKIDHTERMLSWSATRIQELEKENLCGFVFKSRSPSSGMQGVKIYNETGMPAKKGPGLFAKEMIEHFPFMPMEDEGRLNDGPIRENFIERLFVVHRWKTFVEDDGSPKGLVDFHTRHKLLLMAHSPKHLRQLGKLVADTKRGSKAELFGNYFEQMMEGLKLQTTVKKNTNVLNHIMGYFKKDFSSRDKKEILEIIEHYHRALIPLIAPIVLLRHYAHKYEKDYLKMQYYLDPHPAELMLRNHV